MFLAIYNWFAIPVQFAFNPEFSNHPAYIAVDSMINLIFIIDVIINFRTTFIHKVTGEEIIEAKKIAINYIKSRFLIDLIASIPFDNIADIFIPTGNTSTLNLITLLKLFRVLRLGRLISIMKVKDDIKLSLRLLKLVFFLALYLHFQGWLWYYIVIKDKTWTPPINYNYPDEYFYSENLSYKYFTCLYQSVQIFAGGDIGPITKFQLAYWSFFIMIGAIINANLFGQLAVIFSNLNRKASNFQEKFDSTTSTMKNLNLPEKLQTKVTGYLTYTQSLLDSQNELKSFLDVISPSLREEVIQHIFAETLRNNSIFNFDESLIQFLTKKLKTQIHMPEDEIITQGEDGDNLYIISKGEWVVLVRDHNSVTEYTNVLEPGDIFGEIALLLNCKRTATVRTSNYTTIACVNKPTFQDLCQQYIELSYKLREKLKSYNDKIKLFFYTSLRSIDFMSNLDNDIIEEITYHLKQTYYNADETICKAGDYVANLYFITRGEIELVYHINGFDIIIHNLYQGCYIGGYQILGNYNHKLTARTLSNTTLHLLSRDSLNILTNTIPEFKTNIDKATKYLNTTQDPLVGFGLFRDSLGSIQPKDILKTWVIKLIGINRDFKEAGVENGVEHILEKTQIKSIEIQKEQSNTQIEMFDLLTKIALKLDSIGDRVKRLESLQYECEDTNNQK